MYHRNRGTQMPDRTPQMYHRNRGTQMPDRTPQMYHRNRGTQMPDQISQMYDRDGALPCDRPTAGHEQHQQHAKPGGDRGLPRGGERDRPAALHAPAPLPATVTHHLRA
jgi:hypothetical protein